jgi:uncharacterized membrane protein
MSEHAESRRRLIHLVGKVGFSLVVLLALVGLFSVVRRFVMTVRYLENPEVAAVPDPIKGFNARYYQHPYLTLVHVVAGFLFMTLGPLQFVAAIRNRWLGFHRWCGRIFIVASLVGVFSAFIFVPVLPIFGTFTSKVAASFGGVLFLICLVKGYLHIRRYEIAQHREWMIRAFAIGLGISTFRVLIPLLMMPPLRATFPEAWDTVTWLGFVLNVIVAEAWINVTRPFAAEFIRPIVGRRRTQVYDVDTPVAAVASAPTKS